VTKGFGPEAALAAIRAGLSDIGENYAAELLAKQADVASSLGTDEPPRWHYLGAVQRNKVGRLAPVVTCWQSVSRLEEATAIASRTEARTPEVFVEVDVSGQAGRGGCSLEEAPAVVEAAREAGCCVRGLMTVAPFGPPSLDTLARQELAAEAFGKVARLASRLQLGELSMGMSHDLEQAVAAGSTMVRIGTALFGERASR
jgi:pyridoxal phosphate enzyme (YggS family)